MKFNEIIGQQKIKERLIQSVKENRISHAQLFYGPEGSGTLAMALAYAQYINCTQRSENESCGTCSNCLKYQKLVHPDLHFAFPIAKGSQKGESARVKDPICKHFIVEWRTAVLDNPYISLNQWLNSIGLENKQASIFKQESREIVKTLGLKSFEAEYKTMIIWLPEKMNASAANNLLKLIEEPPSKTLFLLISENTDLILKTILSRTQIISFPKIKNENVFDAIKKTHNLHDNQIWDIVKIANGNLNLANQLIESNEENELFLDYFTKYMRLSFQKSISAIQELNEQIVALGREKQKSFLIYASRMIRENFIKNFQEDSINFMTINEDEFSAKFSPFINERNVLLLENEINKAHYEIMRNVNAKIIFFDLAIKINKLLKL